MPVTLGAEIYDWLDPGFRDIAPAAELLKLFNDKSAFLLARRAIADRIAIASGERVLNKSRR